jgi:hypothetical protein
MRNLMKVAVFAVALAVPAAAFAQGATAAPAQKKSSASTAAKKEAAPKVASHTTSGVVKSVSDSSLIITKGGKDETFTVNASTKKDGDVAAGAKVTVAYTTEGKDMTATSIKAAAAKTAAAKKPAKK